MSNAERQRRYRERKRAELRKLAAEAQQETVVAPAVTAPVTPVTHRGVTTDAPDLGDRGRRLWSDTVDDLPDLTSRERVLLEEACRAADRLDTLDRILRGDDEVWLRFRVSEDGDEVTVVVNQVLAEARQQQSTLARLLAELRQGRSGGRGQSAGRGGGQPAGTNAGGSGRGGGVADLTARIADRIAQTSG